MPWTFPLSFAAFANILPVASFQWFLERYEETSGTARGDILTREIAAPKWRADVSLRPMLPTMANEVEAMVEVLGSINAFALCDLRKCYPMRDPDGSILGDSTVTVYGLGSDGKSMRLTGLPSGYVVHRGDMLSVGAADEKRHLYRIVENATAAVAGTTPLFEVRPHVKLGTSVGNSVALRKPWANMRMMSYTPGDRSGRFVSGSGFTALETY